MFIAARHYVSSTTDILYTYSQKKRTIYQDFTFKDIQGRRFTLDAELLIHLSEQLKIKVREKISPLFY